MPTAEQIIRAAAAEVGTAEAPVNDVKYNTWFYGRRVNGSNYAWCKVFVSWVLFKLGITHYRHASCDLGMADFKSGKAGKWIPVTQKAQPADIAFYGDNPNDSIHTGFVVKDNGSTIDAIEGNTSPGTSGSQTNGGGVYRRNRPKTWVLGYGRLDLKPEAPTFKVIARKVVTKTVVSKAKAKTAVARLRERGYKVTKKKVG